MPGVKKFDEILIFEVKTFFNEILMPGQKTFEEILIADVKTCILMKF